MGKTGFFKRTTIYFVLCASLFITVLFCRCVNVSAAENGLDTSVSGDNTTNLVVFVNFSDSDHNHISSIWGKCFLENPNLEKLFYNSSNSLRQYIRDLTYNNVRVANIFPQYNNQTKKIVAITLPHTASYYKNGYPQNADNIVTDTVSILKNENLVNTAYNLDRDNDGMIDNLTIVISDKTAAGNAGFSGLSASYPAQLMINGKRVLKYNIITESGAYLSVGQSGLIIHEFMHALGYKDLYRNGTPNPVGVWDIMSSESMFLQAPLAYQRMKISNAFSIPTVTTNQSGYKLNSVFSAFKSDAPAEIKNNQALILKTPYSDDEFFVVEYRKKQSEEGAYERKIYGSGLVIYRVNNTTTYKENKGTGPYHIYVFRPNDTWSEGVENAGGDIALSYFSSGSYGLSDLSKGLSDNAITYSDGTNSGIVIKNISITQSDTITFDIEFNNAKDYWETVSNDNIESGIFQLDTLISSSGKIYAAADFYAGSSESPALFRIDGNNWNKIANLPDGSDYQISEFGGKIFLLYCGTDYKVHLKRLDGSLWSEDFYKSNGDMSYAAIVRHQSGLYITVCSSDSVETVKYTDSVENLGTITGLSYPFNAKINIVGNAAYLVFREAFNDNRIHVYKYGNGLWTLVDSSMFSSGNNGIDTVSCNDNLYLIDDGRTVFRFNGQFTRVGPDITQESSAYYALAEGNNHELYVLYKPLSSSMLSCVCLNNNTWRKIGESVTNNAAISFVKLIRNEEKLYAFYMESSNGNATIKSHSIPKKVCSHMLSVIKEACHEDGRKKCTICGYTESIPALQDFPVVIKNKTGTYSGDIYCRTCNQLMIRGSIITNGEETEKTSGSSSGSEGSTSENHTENTVAASVEQTENIDTTSVEQTENTGITSENNPELSDTVKDNTDLDNETVEDEKKTDTNHKSKFVIYRVKSIQLFALLFYDEGDWPTKFQIGTPRPE